MRLFLDLATKEDAVTNAYAVTGAHDVMLMLYVADMDEYDVLCERLFRERTNVTRFWTMIVIRTAKEDTSIAL